jgi:hypothetical protein
LISYIHNLPEIFQINHFHYNYLICA